MSNRIEVVSGRGLERPTFVDLFCGAGGLSSGFAQAGFRLLAAADKVSVFIRSHETNFPQARSVAVDLGHVSPAELCGSLGVQPNQVDVVVGGPPCQTFSTIGAPKIRSLQGQLATDPRNYLFEPFIEFIEHVRPSVAVMENVPALRTKFDGELFGRIIGRLEAAGYRVAAEVLNAAEYGVPQTRKRLFIVAYRNGIQFRFPRATHVLETNCRSHVSQNLALSLDDALEAAVTVGQAIDDLPKVYDGCREDELPYSRHDNLSSFQMLSRARSGLTVRNNICRMSNERAKTVFKHMHPGSKYMDLPSEVRRILPFREDIFHDRLKRLDSAKPSWTVLAHIGMDGYMYIHPDEDRTLSVREAARLQSFPDDFLFVGNMREQYVQVGNAVPPVLAYAVACAVKVSLGV